MNDNENKGMNRRTFVQATTAAAGLGIAARATGARAGTLPFVTNGKIIVNVFLRGAADGLSICWPVGEPVATMTGLRPTIAIQRTRPLTPYFGLSIAMKKLHTRVWNQNHMAIIHGVGLPTKERSHFKAMDDWEYAGSTSSGWIGRLIGQITNPSVIRGMSVSDSLPTAMLGGEKVLPIANPAGFNFKGTPDMETAVANMYANEPDPAGSAVADTLAAINLVDGPQQHIFADYTPLAGVTYPSTSFASNLKDVAAGIKEGLCADAYEVDLGGWDHHNNQDPNAPDPNDPNAVPGLMFELKTILSEGLAAFHDDLLELKQGSSDTYLSDVVIVVQTEFGRRVAENSSLGTDHGHGGVMLVIAEDVNPGVYANAWTQTSGSLVAEMVDSDGDLKATTDYREVLYHVLAHQYNLNPSQMNSVLPGYTVPGTPIPLF